MDKGHSSVGTLTGCPSDLGGIPSDFGSGVGGGLNVSEGETLIRGEHTRKGFLIVGNFRLKTTRGLYRSEGKGSLSPPSSKEVPSESCQHRLQTL